jgi:hypothetical protein
MIFHGVLGALAVKRKEAARLQSTLREEIFIPAERTSELNASPLAVRELWISIALERTSFIAL